MTLFLWSDKFSDPVLWDIRVEQGGKIGTGKLCVVTTQSDGNAFQCVFMNEVFGVLVEKLPINKTVKA